MFGGFLQLLRFWRNDVPVVCDYRAVERKHIVQHEIESVCSLYAVLLEPVEPKCFNCRGKPIDWRIDPSWSDSNCFSRVFWRGVIDDLFDDILKEITSFLIIYISASANVSASNLKFQTHHNFIKPDVSGVCDKGLFLGIHNGLFQDAHKFCLEKPFTPFWHSVCFCQ